MGHGGSPIFKYQIFQRLLLSPRRSPYAAPSIRGVYRDQPEGAPQGCGAAAEGLGSPFCRPSINVAERRKKAASGCLFFWILFFGQAKKSISAVGPRPDF
ncbi:hypothetical protein C2U68_06785 [Methylomonas koyamae]|nr:hypothetical protein C2U68_06785 [Methylomonas koyamae]